MIGCVKTICPILRNEPEEIAKKNYCCKEGGRYWSSKSINGGSCNIDDCYLDFIINYATNLRFALYRVN